MWKTRRVALAALIVGTCILAMPSALGDDFLHPGGNILEVHSETVLSGLDISKATIDEAIERLGRPSDVSFTPRSGTTSSTWVYEWQTKVSRLKITVVEYWITPKIMKIDVWGTAAESRVDKTGRGLRLGDTVDDARRIYRLRSYFGTTLPEPSGSFLSGLNGSNFGPILEVNFNSDGKINHMQLTDRGAWY